MSEASYTIGQFARRFGLSRSTLLYYDNLGLMVPSGRSVAGYRLYSAADVRRMEAIQRLRGAGIPLKEIGALIDADQGRIADRLARRLSEINSDISRLRYQQQVIVALLKNEGLQRKSRVLNKKAWVALLRAAGLDEAGMRRWHREFELMSPETHQDFLESLGIDLDEIGVIRRWSQSDG